MSIFGPPCLEGSGNQTTDTRNVGPFNSITVETAADLTVTQGSPQNLEVTADDNIQPIITTEVSNDVLVIAETECYTGRDGVQVAATIPTVNTLKTTSSGNITGSGLSLQNPELETTASGKITLTDITATAVTVNVSASGGTTVTGTASSLTAKTSASGNITADACAVQTADVTTSGSGNIKVNATDTLKVTISGSGNVYYTGSPTIEQHITGSGKLIHQ